eukprot:1154608-Pelagomonas_calceolata.AAC.2
MCASHEAIGECAVQLPGTIALAFAGCGSSTCAGGRQPSLLVDTMYSCGSSFPAALAFAGLWQQPTWPLLGCSSSLCAGGGQPCLLPWPLLSCGSSPRAEGGRPSLLVKAQWEEPSSSHHSSSTGGVQQGGQAKRDRKAAEDPTQGSVRPEAAQWDKSAANPQLAGGNGAAGVARVGCRSHVELLPVTAWVCEASVARVTAALEPLMQALGSGSSKDSSTAGEGTSRPGPPSQQRQLVFEQHKPGDLGSRVGSSSDSLWVNSAGVKGSQERRDEAAQQQELSSTCLEVTLSVPQVCIVLMAAAAGMPGGAAGSEGPEQQVQRGVHHHHHQKDVGSQQCASGPRQGQQEPRSSAVGSSSSSSSSSSHTQNAVYIALDLMCGSHHPHVSLQRIPPHRGVPLLRCVRVLRVCLCARACVCVCA